MMQYEQIKFPIFVCLVFLEEEYFISSVRREFSRIVIWVLSSSLKIGVFIINVKLSFSIFIASFEISQDALAIFKRSLASIFST